MIVLLKETNAAYQAKMSTKNFTYLTFDILKSNVLLISGKYCSVLLE